MHTFSFIRSELVQAMAWTLIHSLWQGLLLALATGALLLMTRKSHAKRRYELLTGLFFLFLAVVGFTFLHEIRAALSNRHQLSFTNKFASRSVINAIIPFNNSHILVNRSWAERIKDYFTENAYLLVMIWFIVFIARVAKLISELAYIQRLKHYRNSEPAAEWKKKLKELVIKMNIHQYVQLLESELIKVPVVMGILKPIILVPVGLLTQLPSDEIEAILLHELAHIKRRDYFVNLLQSFAETVFFFNPALLWLSSLMREERENCCDDLAISVTNNKHKFIDALISFQEFDLEKPTYGMGFAANKYPLLNRVKRIISNKNKSLNTTEKSILTLGFALLILISFVAAKKLPSIKLRKTATQTHQSASAKPFTNENHVISLVPPKARVKEDIIGFSEIAANYNLPFRRLTDTTAPPAPAVNSGYYVTADTLIRFKSYTTNVSTSNTTTTLEITAVQDDGTVFKLTRVDGVLTVFSIDDHAMPESLFGKNSQLIKNVELPYLQKKENVILMKEKNAMLREQQLNEEGIRSLHKMQQKGRPDTVRGYIEGKEIRSTTINFDSVRVSLQKKQQEVEHRLSELNGENEMKMELKRDAARLDAILKNSKNRLAVDTSGLLVSKTSEGFTYVHIVNGIFTVDNAETHIPNTVSVYNKNGDLVKSLTNYKNNWNVYKDHLPGGYYYYYVKFGEYPNQETEYAFVRIETPGRQTKKESFQINTVKFNSLNPDSTMQYAKAERLTSLQQQLQPLDPKKKLEQLPNAARIVNGVLTIDKITAFPKNSLLVYNSANVLVKTIENYRNDWNIYSGKEKLAPGKYFWAVLLNGENTGVVIRGFIKLDRGEGNQQAQTKLLPSSLKPTTVLLRRQTDSLKREIALTQQRLNTLQKMQSTQVREIEGHNNVQSQADQIRNIIADLEKENIQVDLRKGWFALDKNRFIVNATKMSPQVHARFKAKYLRGKNTPGYFYGPVQLEGRGVFMDYKDLSR